MERTAGSIPTARPSGGAGDGQPAVPAGSGGRTAVLVGAVGSLLTVVGIVTVWEAVRRIGSYPSFILPSPAAVAARLGEIGADGTLWHHASVTVSEAGLGLGIALVAALVVGYPLARVPLLEIVATPLIAASQAVPAVAIAPLLVLWLGTGAAPKVAIAAVIVFFPLVVATITGLRGVERALLEVARVFGATRRQIFWYVELPLAAPALLGGLKLGLTLALTGAVVGEFVASDSGLGYLINWSREGSFDTSLLFAALIVLIALSSVLYGAISLLERILLQWRE
ncbi:MAG: ABC transporter permease [Chloroflexota bacterium]